MTNLFHHVAPVCSETFALGDSTITLETGRVARQADAAVVLREKDSMLLATVVTEAIEQPTLEPYLTVEYRERAAAVGRIPGNYFRRELRPGEHEILLNRSIDRSLRPLLPEFYDRSIQLQITVFSADPSSDLFSLALLAASAAMALSPVPLFQPVAGARFIRSQGKSLALFRPELHKSIDLDVFVTSTPEGVVAVDGEVGLLSLDVLCECLAFAHDALQPALDALLRLQHSAGVMSTRWEPLSPDPVLEERVSPFVAKALALEYHQRRSWREAMARLRKEAISSLCRVSQTGKDREPLPQEEVPAIAGEVGGSQSDEGSVWDAYHVGCVFDLLVRQAVRTQILEGQRRDGRGPKELRPISAEVGYLPRCHGSAVFTRGDTQALVSATLGRLGEGQNTETLWGQQTSNFLLHYNFPGYATGQIARFRPPGFREYGHGHLARRAFLPLLPKLRKTIRVVSDITESFGSSSMATVCGASLSMMDAGVPLAEHVAGVAVGLVRDSDQSVILSDITGDEDACGEMDLKLTGSPSGITSVQLDSKQAPLSLALLKEALQQSWTSVQEILQRLSEVIPPTGPLEERESENKKTKTKGKRGASRDSRSSERMPEPEAKVSLQYNVDSSMVGRVIGSKGRNIRTIERNLPVKVKVQNDGTVLLQGEEMESLKAARHQVKALLLTLQKQKAYLAVVTDISDSGAAAQIGDHLGWITAHELGEQAEGLQTGRELLVTPLGSDDKGKLLLGHATMEGFTSVDALNYVADSEESQIRIQDGSKA